MRDVHHILHLPNPAKLCGNAARALSLIMSHLNP
jgi:hypothetical protein